MNILVAGAGYLGLPLALSLRQLNHRVWGWVYSQESSAALHEAGLEFICGDLAEPDLWRQPPVVWDRIYYCPSTSGGGVEAYDRLHRIGLGHALAHLPASGRLLYTSSTSVYGQTDGGSVDENSATEPTAEGSKLLLEAERRVLRRGGQVLRLAGIYGPQRCVYLRKLREGRATMPGDGSRWVNQIHRDDAVAALKFLGDSARPSAIWNVVDDEAVSLKYLYQWMADATGLPLPESGGEEQARKRGLTHKRVLNAKLRSVGWTPRYPTFREGYRDLL